MSFELCSIYCISKIGDAGDGADCRDFTIKSGIVQPLIALIKPDLEVCTLYNLKL